MATLLAGIDYHVPGCTVNRFCASSLQTTRMAFHAIKSGEGDTTSRPASRPSRARRRRAIRVHPKLDGSEGSPTTVHLDGHDRRERRRERNVSREAQDAWALISQTRAVAAQESGHFDKEIVPVTAPAHKDVDREGNEIDVPETVVTKDDGPRPGTTLEALAGAQTGVQRGRHGHRRQRLPAQRRRRGAADHERREGQASGLHAARADLASTVAAIRPEVMGLGPIPAIQALLKNTGMSIDDIDVVEINEAFAAQIVPCKDELGTDDEKLNPFGGAIALGHPFGMTGARIMTTLLNDLETLDKTYGIESMCVAGGMGMAMLVERV